MGNYLAISRKHRPSLFSEVIGQESAVTALRNALEFSRISHAYLFSGTRGCGKTTLARIFAKALNCRARSSKGDPCNGCASCRQIDQNCSMDVVEIDGASHRGIDDIRQLRESAEYSASEGAFKVYIVDEVHMLTKEAFNALLKTLEEPPPQVKFLLATTEPHRVPLTVLSRCQHFALNLVEMSAIAGKLKRILEQSGISYDEPALHLIARRAEGSVRDAESTLDQMLCFSSEKLQLEQVQRILGVVDVDWFFKLDSCVERSAAVDTIDLTEVLFLKGLDFASAIQQLLVHFRHHLVLQLHGSQKSLQSNLLQLPLEVTAEYFKRADIYTQEQCLHILELIRDYQRLVRAGGCTRIYFEMLLVKIASSKTHISYAAIWQKLQRVENLLQQMPQVSTIFDAGSLKVNISEQNPLTGQKTSCVDLPIENPIGDSISHSRVSANTSTEKRVSNPIIQHEQAKKPSHHRAADWMPSENQHISKSEPTAERKTPSSEHLAAKNLQPHRCDTLVQFAAVEFSAQIDMRAQNSQE